MRTLLDVVQGILASMGGDEVSSITDSTESLLIANSARDTFHYLAAQMTPPEDKILFNLEAVQDLTRPTVMTRPSTIINMEWLKYQKTVDGESRWTNLTYVNLVDFLMMNYEVQEGLSSYQYSTDGMLYTIYYKSDIDPSYYTSIDDTTILFDAYDASLESTLTSAKTLGFGRKDWSFRLEDDFVPHFDANINELWYNQTKSQAFVDQKQVTNPVSDYRSKKIFQKDQKDKFDMPHSKYGDINDKLPHYGRKR